MYRAEEPAGRTIAAQGLKLTLPGFFVFLLSIHLCVVLGEMCTQSHPYKHYGSLLLTQSCWAWDLMFTVQDIRNNKNESLQRMCSAPVYLDLSVTYECQQCSFDAAYGHNDGHNRLQEACSTCVVGLLELNCLQVEALGCVMCSGGMLARRDGSPGRSRGK